MVKLKYILIVIIATAFLLVACSDLSSRSSMIELYQEAVLMPRVAITGSVNLEVKPPPEIIEEFGGGKDYSLLEDVGLAYSGQLDYSSGAFALDFNLLHGELVEYACSAIFDTAAPTLYIKNGTIADFIAAGDRELFDIFADSLQDKSWLAYNFSEFDNVPNRSQLAKTKITEYLVLLEREVYAEFDCAQIETLPNGYELRLDSQGFSDFLRALGTYTSEHIEDFVSVTQDFFAGLTEEELASLFLNEDKRDGLLLPLDEVGFREAMLSAMYSALVELAGLKEELGDTYLVLRVENNDGVYTTQFEFFHDINWYREEFDNTTTLISWQNEFSPLKEIEVPTPAAADVSFIEEDSKLWLELQNLASGWQEWNDDYWYEVYANGSFWLADTWFEEYWEEYWDDEYWDAGYWDDEYWDDEYWDDEYWDDEYWDDEYWDDEYWDDEYWDDEYWDDEYWDDDYEDEDDSLSGEEGVLY